MDIFYRAHRSISTLPVITLGGCDDRTWDQFWFMG